MPVDAQIAARNVYIHDEAPRHKWNEADPACCVVADFKHVGCSSLDQPDHFSQRLGGQIFDLKADQVMPKVGPLRRRCRCLPGYRDLSAPERQGSIPVSHIAKTDSETVAISLPLQDHAPPPPGFLVSTEPPLVVSEDAVRRTTMGADADPTLYAECAPDLAEDERVRKRRTRRSRRWQRRLPQGTLQGLSLETQAAAGCCLTRSATRAEGFAPTPNQ